MIEQPRNSPERRLLCPQCGAPGKYDAVSCDYCGAVLSWEKGSCRVVLNGAGNHPALIISTLQAVADYMFSSGRAGNTMTIARTIKGLGLAMKNGVGIDDPVVLFETDNIEEAEYVRKKIEENGGSVVIE